VCIGTCENEHILYIQKIDVYIYMYAYMYKYVYINTYMYINNMLYKARLTLNQKRVQNEKGLCRGIVPVLHRKKLGELLLVNDFNIVKLHKKINGSGGGHDDRGGVGWGGGGGGGGEERKKKEESIEGGKRKDEGGGGEREKMKKRVEEGGSGPLQVAYREEARPLGGGEREISVITRLKEISSPIVIEGQERKRGREGATHSRRIYGGGGTGLNISRTLMFRNWSTECNVPEGGGGGGGGGKSLVEEVERRVKGKRERGGGGAHGG
jgi:hypothetical protein